MLVRTVFLSIVLTPLFIHKAYTTPIQPLPAPDAAPVPMPMLIDDFSSPYNNNLGRWHGPDTGLNVTYGDHALTIHADGNPAYSYYTRLAGGCYDIGVHEEHFLHIEFGGSNEFSIALQEHNAECEAGIAPYPATWDEVEARLYTAPSSWGGDIYVPISHFRYRKERTVALALRAFYTDEPTVLMKIEIVETVPKNYHEAVDFPTGKLVFACTRPNSFAFTIDDGIPGYAQEVMQIIKDEGIPVTFFAVGSGLLDPTTNLSNIYREMRDLGHQIALHSFSHRAMESFQSYAEIVEEYQLNIDAFRQVFDEESRYFRPPYGIVGARMRRELAVMIKDPYIVNWSIDIEDYIWGDSDTPEKQLEAFRRGLERGGNLVVTHYLFPSTVEYFREFIHMAQATGRRLMRVDQCMEDPNAPPLEDE